MCVYTCMQMVQVTSSFDMGHLWFEVPVIFHGLQWLAHNLYREFYFCGIRVVYALYMQI